MRKYEGLIIVVPEVGEEGLQQVAQRFAALVENSGGSVDVLRSLGRKALAYRIGAHLEGIYVLMQFFCDPSAVDALRRELRLSEQVIRSLIVRVEEGVPLKEEALAEEEIEEEAALTEVGEDSSVGLEGVGTELDVSESGEVAAIPGLEGHDPAEVQPPEATSQGVLPEGGEHHAE